MATKRIRIPLNIVVDSVDDEVSKVKAAYFTDKRSILIEYDRGFREVSVDFENEKIKNEITLFRKLAILLFDNGSLQPSQLDENVSIIERYDIQNQNFHEDITKLLIELQNYIKSISILLSARIYKKTRKYVSERTIEEFLMNNGLSAFIQLIEKPIEEIYKTLRNYEKNILVPKYNKELHYV